MGRLRGLFCSFCLDDRADHANVEPALGQDIDVSHLATPHVTASPAVAVDRSLTPNTPENSTEDRYSNNFDNQQPSNSNSFSVTSPLQHNHYQQSQPSSTQNSTHRIDDVAPSHVRPGPNFLRETSPTLQSPPTCPPASIANLYAPSQGDHNEPALIEIQNQNQHIQQRLPPARDPSNNPQPPPPPPPPPSVIARNLLPSTSNGATTKLSYDIISVREPLAKILAERQQLLQNQQQQRQILGDHEYIEVYGERGSSCFYEEIAGSVTSSATYDQIGAASNHNYQVLINAYSVANRNPPTNRSNYDANPPAQDVESSPQTSNGPRETNGNPDHENAYDTTNHANNRMDRPSTTVGFSNSPSDGQKQPSTSVSNPIDMNSSDNVQLTQSIPVYSVINKATRRSSSIMRANLDDNRPPKPPPKNLFITHQQPSTSAMIYEDTSNISKHDTTGPKMWNIMPQIPSTSSCMDNHPNNDRSDSPGCNHLNNRLPQPPPRHSKNSAFSHTTDRPLPSPNTNADNLNNNNSNRILDQSISNCDDDIESINNGYELLRSNLEDDQIDVGYEKIRESNRYSGGSISSQFYSRQLLDNGGYESVQPIYSSPSNCYEVLNPATASEIAAAAAAKLNVLEKFLNKDQ